MVVGSGVCTGHGRSRFVYVVYVRFGEWAAVSETAKKLAYTDSGYEVGKCQMVRPDI